MSDRIDPPVIILDIKKLNEGEEVLMLYNFPAAKWFDLGQKLLVDFNLLKAIESNYADVRRCLKEVLNIWLTNASELHRTWNWLAQALKNIGEIVVAEKILKHMADPVSQLLQQYSEKLSQIVIPDQEVHLLHTEKIITPEAAKEMKDMHNCHSGLLTCGPFRVACAKVAEDHYKFKRLVAILERCKGTQELVKEMRAVCDKYHDLFPDQPAPSDQKTKADNNTSSNDTPANSPDTTHMEDVTTCSDVIKFNLDREFKVKFDDLRDKLGSLFHNIAPLIEAIIPSVKDLKMFLRRCRPELEFKLEEADESFDNVMKIVENECSIMNVTLLISIVRQYPVVHHETDSEIVSSYPDVKANKLLSTYEKDFNDFCMEETSLHVLNNRELRRFSSAQLVCEMITFTVDWKIEEHNANDIKDYLTKTFGSLAKRVELVRLNDKNSITVTCYAPHYQMESLLLVARENLPSLIKTGLIDLTIGYHTLYDRRLNEVSPLMPSLYHNEKNLERPMILFEEANLHKENDLKPSSSAVTEENQAKSLPNQVPQKKFGEISLTEVEPQHDAQHKGSCQKQTTMKHLDSFDTDEVDYKVVSLADVEYKAVPLVHPNNLMYDDTTGQLVPNTCYKGNSLCSCSAGMKLLASIGKPLAVISIAGPSYTGKTYILSRILGSPDGFKIDRGAAQNIHSQTHSIWISTHALEYRDRIVVLLLADTDAAVDTNCGLLALTLLLSSQFIYNLFDVPRQADITKMWNTIELAKSVAHPQQSAPNCLWLLRNFLRKLKDYRSNEDLSSRQFLLQEILRYTDTHFQLSPDDQSHSARMEIVKYFPSLECFALPPPSLDVDVLDDVGKYHDKLSSEFNDAVEKLLSVYLAKSAVPLKKVFQSSDPINGKILALLTKQYIERLNKSGSITPIGFDDLRKNILHDLVDKYQALMRQKIDEISTKNETLKIPLEIEADPDAAITPSIMSLHRLIVTELSKQLLGKFRPFSLLINEKKVLFEDFRSSLVQYKGDEVTGGALYEFLVANKEVSKAFCQSQWSRHYQVIEEKLACKDSSYTYWHYVHDLSDVRCQYMTSAKGPAKWDVLSEVMTNLRSAEKLPGYDCQTNERLEKIIIPFEVETKADEEKLQFRVIQQREDSDLEENLIKNVEEEMKHQTMKVKTRKEKRRHQEEKKQSEIVEIFRKELQLLKQEMQNEMAKERKLEMEKKEQLYIQEFEKSSQALEKEFRMSVTKQSEVAEGIKKLQNEARKKQACDDRELQKLKLDISRNRSVLEVILQSFLGANKYEGVNTPLQQVICKESMITMKNENN